MSQLPLINQAVAGLEPIQYASGIALNNMIRQIGGAFGIALANNYVSLQYAQHRSDIVSKLTPGSPALTERIEAISNAMISKTGDAATAMDKAYRMIEMTVDKQAYFLAYQDTFRLVGIFFLAVLPLVFFLKVKKKKEQTNDPAAMKKAMDAAH
jgi:DHA2 family multidrug resistance protein